MPRSRCLMTSPKNPSEPLHAQGIRGRCARFGTGRTGNLRSPEIRIARELGDFAEFRPKLWRGCRGRHQRLVRHRCAQPELARDADLDRGEPQDQARTPTRLGVSARRSERRVSNPRPSAWEAYESMTIGSRFGRNRGMVSVVVIGRSLGSRCGGGVGVRVQAGHGATAAAKGVSSRSSSPSRRRLFTASQRS
jgi:hypothetical protein